MECNDCGPREFVEEGGTSDEFLLSDCEKRYQCLTKTRKCRDLIAYSVDTCVISYKPRVLTVPSEDFDNLDDALAVIAPNQGGYVIRLCEGRVHSFTRNICLSVDDLTIIGDCNPLAGVAFINSYRFRSNEVIAGEEIFPPPIDEVPYCSYMDASATHGNLVIKGSARNISVVGSFSNPNFSCLCPGTKLIFFDATGKLFHSRVVSAQDNILTVDRDITIFRNNDESLTSRHGGTGFFVVPNVTLHSDVSGIDWRTTTNLTFVGLNIDVPAFFNVAGVSGVFRMSHCHVANNIRTLGRYDLTDPNVFTGLMFVNPASDGIARHQAFVSAYAHLEGVNGEGYFEYCWFISTIHGVELKSCGDISFYGCRFENNCLALSADTKSNASINLTQFTHNQHAILCTNQSQVSAVPLNIPGWERATLDRYFAGAVFTRNLVVIIAAYNSYVILPTTRGFRNHIPFIVDSKLFTTIESNGVGITGQNGSVVNILPNPFVPDPIGLHCTDPENVHDFDDTRVDIEQLYALDTFGVASPSFIQRIVGPNDGQVVHANHTLDVLSEERGNTMLEPRLRGFLAADIVPAGPGIL